MCSAREEVVPMSNILKGYKYDPDRYVIFQKQVQDNVKLQSTKIIDIEAFVDIKEVHTSRFEALYFEDPNGDIDNPTYSITSQI